MPTHRFNFPAHRTVFEADACEWLQRNSAGSGTSIVTSLPDWSEMGGMKFSVWCDWFSQVSREIIDWIPEGGVAIFYQSDIYHEHQWVDKSYLILRALTTSQAYLLWRKVVCRRPPGTIAPGRPSFSHLLCFGKSTPRQLVKLGPDVIVDAGHMSWPRAMGEGVCRTVCRFLKDETDSSIVVDPFCGQGAVLAAANSFGMNAVGVDLSPRRVREARNYMLKSF